MNVEYNFSQSSLKTKLFGRLFTPPYCKLSLWNKHLQIIGQQSSLQTSLPTEAELLLLLQGHKENPTGVKW